MWQLNLNAMGNLNDFSTWSKIMFSRFTMCLKYIEWQFTFTFYVILQVFKKWDTKDVTYFRWYRTICCHLGLLQMLQITQLPIFSFDPVDTVCEIIPHFLFKNRFVHFLLLVCQMDSIKLYTISFYTINSL